MFKHKKGLSISLLASLALFSSFAEAVVPNAPGAYIGVTDIDKTSVRVNFLDNADNEDGFLLFDKSGDINVTIPENNETASSQTYVTLTGLTCGRVYTLKALAFNSDGYSEMSDARSFNIHSTFGVDCNGTNKAPVANAGADQNITFGESVTLDASKSSDSDGAIVSYSWKDSNGKNIEDKEAIVTVDNLSIGTHTFTVTVTDDEDETASDSMKVIVKSKDPIDLEKGLVAHYEFEGNTDDSSGNGNDGTEHGGVSYVDGVIGQAGSFDGVDDYIEVVHDSSLNMDKKLTLSLWINIKALPSLWSPIIHKGGEYTTPHCSNREYSLWINHSNFLHLTSAGDNSVQKYYNTDSNVFKTNEWFLYTAVIDRNSHNIRIYIDGDLKYTFTDEYSSFNKNANNLRIAWTEENSGGFSLYNGQLDDLRIYNRALNEVEIKALYNKNPSSRYSYYDKWISWADAKKSCEEKNSHLATISSEEENKIIHKLIANGSQEVYYLGGTDEESEGTWKWITDEEFDYINWDGGEPNNLANEDYLMIYKNDGTWNDLSLFNNSWRSIGYICEREI